MDHDTFIGQVQNRAHLPSRGDAEKATRATLETLAERLTPEAADNLASELPQEINLHLRRTGEEFERMDPSNFLRRVAEREQADEPDATFHARAVLEVVQEAVSPGAFDKVRQQLPEEFNRLLDAGSQGRMRKPE